MTRFGPARNAKPSPEVGDVSRIVQAGYEYLMKRPDSSEARGSGKIPADAESGFE